MSASKILKDYNMDRETARKLVDSLVRLNKKDSAEETGVSEATVYRYKKKMNSMSKKERNTLIAQLAIENLETELEDIE